MTEDDRLQIYLSLIDTATDRAQTLAGSAAAALGVFMAAFVVAFVEESYAYPAIDLISEILFVVGAGLLLRCIFRATRPISIEDPLDEKDIETAWRRSESLYLQATRAFWVGTLLLALSVGMLISADILTDIGLLPGKP